VVVVTPSVAALGVTHPSDATARKIDVNGRTTGQTVAGKQLHAHGYRTASKFTQFAG